MAPPLPVECPERAAERRVEGPHRIPAHGAPRRLRRLADDGIVGACLGSTFFVVPTSRSTWEPPRTSRGVSPIIHQINDISNTIASAVEEQTATTNEIGRNVNEAAKGTSEIAQNIAGVATAARSTSDGARSAQEASAQLEKMAADLQAIVNRFSCS